MAIIGLNSKVLDKIIGTLGLQSAVDKLPVDLMPTIQPVISADPDREVNEVSTALNASSGDFIVYTVPSVKHGRFFVTGLGLSHAADSICDNTFIRMNIFPKGKGSSVIIRMAKLPLIAFNDSVNLDFSTPIELEPGSLVTGNTTFSTGTIQSSGNVRGYLLSPL